MPGSLRFGLFPPAEAVMASIDIRQDHDLGREGACKAVERVARQLQDDMGISYQWDGSELTFEGRGATGSILVSDSEVKVVVDLSILLQPIRSQIEKEIRRYLRDALG